MLVLSSFNLVFVSEPDTLKEKAIEYIIQISSDVNCKTLYWVGNWFCKEFSWYLKENILKTVSYWGSFVIQYLPLQASEINNMITDSDHDMTKKIGCMAQAVHFSLRL